MRRSRASLVLFFGTFATLLMAVGFADGRHQSPARPADLYRLDLDDPGDGWSAYCDPRLDEVSRCTSSVSAESSDNVGISGAQGWIFLPIAGSPIMAVIYVDDETACLVAYLEESNDIPAADESFGLDVDNALAGRAAGFYPKNGDGLAAAESSVAFGCDGFPWGRSHSDVVSHEQLAAFGSDRTIDDEIVLAVAAAYAGIPNQFIWQYAIEGASRCQFVWDGCNGFPDASTAGWLDGRAILKTAEVWREIGRTAWKVVERIAHGRDRLITATSRQIVGWLNWPADTADQASRRPTEEAGPRWPSAGRSKGLLLVL